MAKGPAAEQADQGEDGNTPPPHPGPLKTTTLLLPAGTVLYRVHHKRYAANQFNPGVAGNARFSPIRNGEGVWGATEQ